VNRALASALVVMLAAACNEDTSTGPGTSLRMARAATETPGITAMGLWPSDHAGVVAMFGTAFNARP